MPYARYTLSGQQVPWTVEFHDRATGRQRTQMNRALSPMATFADTTTNHSRARRAGLPRVTRSSVSAKDVLLHTAATMDSVPVRLAARDSGGSEVGARADSCWPRPWGTLQVVVRTVPRRASWEGGVRGGGLWEGRGGGGYP